MCSSLTDQVRSIAVVTTAVASGDLTQKIEIQVEGEMSTLKSMCLFVCLFCLFFVYLLSFFCLLTHSLSLAFSLNSLARSHAHSSHSLALVGTVNSMVDQLSAFASEVTRVALEVGTQGILGGQARVEGVQGTWADLTRNVNVRSSLSLSPSNYTPPR